MSNRAQETVIVIALMVVTILLFVVPQAKSLEVESHRAMNEYIAQNTFDGFFIDEYLKKQLGIQEGVKSYFKKDSSNQQVFRWLSDGGQSEDKPEGCIPYWRSRNHFHNPIDNSGFSGWWDTGIFSGISAADWILEPANSQGCGYYSWDDARRYYYSALISADEATRQTGFAQTFRAVGQAMHLVQDMSVPEHTRNDGHYFNDDYEAWVKGISISNYSSVPFLSSLAFPLSITNLFDTNQYNGTNPSVTAQGAIGLAEYTNANFLSPDSIFVDFDYPAYATVLLNPIMDPVSGDKLYLKKAAHGEGVEFLARATSFYNYLPQDYKEFAITVNDPMVYKEYAKHLIPRAIGYSSQVLSYFFRGRLDVEMKAGSMTVTNASNEVMAGGGFELYYDNENGERTPVSDLAGAEVATLPPGAGQTITFDQPQGAKSCMLVYKGILGNETNAVIGKFVDTDKEFVMFTASVGAKKSVVVWDARNNSLVHGPVDFGDETFQAWYLKKEMAGNSLFSTRTFCGRRPGDPPGTVLSGCQELVPGQTDQWAYRRVGGETGGHDEYGPVWDAYDYLDWHNHALKYYPSGFPPQGNNFLAPESFAVGILLPGSPLLYSGFRTEGIFTSTTHGVRVAHDPMGTKSGRAEEAWIFFGPLGKMGEYTAVRTGSGDVFDVNGVVAQNYIPGWTAIIKNPEAFPGSNYAWGRYWYGSSINGQYTESTVANVCMVHYTDAVESYNVENYDKTDWTFTPSSTRTILVQAQALHYPDGSAGKNFVAEGRNTQLELKIKDAITMVYALNGVPENEIKDCQVVVNILK